VDRSEIVNGYEFRKDEYIVIEPEEIKKIEPQTAKTMEILEFVKASDVDSGLFRVVVLHDAGRGGAASLCAVDQGARRERIRGDREDHDAQPRVTRCFCGRRRAA